MEPQARPHRLLIFDRDRSFRGKLQRRIQLLRPDIASETVISISEAEERLGRSDFDAVLVRIDGPDEIEFALSIRVMAPETPVVALLPGPDSTLESRIRGGGGSRTASSILRRIRSSPPERSTASWRRKNFWPGAGASSKRAAIGVRG